MTSAMTMTLRLGATDIALWETLASLAVTIAGGAVLLWGAARVFRAGLLMYGQRMTVRRILTTLRQAG
jgi:ABC-2 type transport system permease protein